MAVEKVVASAFPPGSEGLKVNGIVVVGEQAAVTNIAANYTGQAATNGVVANTSQGAVAVANLADLNDLRTTVAAVLTALKAHGLIASA